MERHEFIEDPIGEMDLTDLEVEDANGGTTFPCFTVTVALCTRNTLCGSCGVLSTGCC